MIREQGAEWGSGALPMIREHNMSKLKTCAVGAGPTMEKQVLRRPIFYQKTYTRK